MSRAPAVESNPKAAPNPPPAVMRRPLSAAARRRRLRRAHRAIHAFEPDNRYQAELKNFILAILDYMKAHWCKPGRAYDFDRWWRIVGYYSHALCWPEMAGPRARKVLKRLLEQNQIPPTKLLRKGVDHEKSLPQARPFHR